MTIEQVKARRPGSIEAMSLNVIHNPESKTTTWDYLGEANQGLDAEARACIEILNLLKENKRMTHGDILRESTAKDSTLRKAYKTLERLRRITYVTGGPGLKPNEKTYLLGDPDDY